MSLDADPVLSAAGLPPLALIGVPIDLGAGRRGVDMGPSAIRYSGLHRRLQQLGRRIVDTGNLITPLAEQHAEPAADDRLKYLEPIAALCRRLADQVEQELAAGRLPIVLGGDHSLTIGSAAGSARQARPGLIWIDAHADFNTDETTPSGNIHGMSLAALTGRGHPLLTAIACRRPAYDSTQVALVGARDLDPLERVALRNSGVRVFTMHDIDRRGMAEVMDEAISVIQRNSDGYHVSFDLDSIDPREAPGVGTPVAAGISTREAHLALEMLFEAGGLRSLDMVEVNPILDERNTTARLAVDLILSASGKRIL
jgi:arginase